MRDKSDLRRSSRTRNERSRVLIVTEGEQTEVQYFKRLRSYLKATGVGVLGVDVKGAGRDPARVVNRASNESRRGALIGSDAGFDAVWCVFDVDDHERLQEAISAARKLGFALAVSNPCFEIWLLWHYEECERHVRPAELRKRLKKHGVVDKDVPKTFDFSKLGVARERARRGEAGDVPGNPGSGVWMVGDHLQNGRMN